MTKTLQLLRGTTAQNNSFTGHSGELTVDTTTNELRLHDGSTAGGFTIPKKSDCQGLLGGGTAGTVLTNSGTPGTVNATALATVATSGLYSDLSGTPTIPAAQVNSDWDAVSGVAEILNKPTTLSGYGITDGADTSLSNITSTGKQVCANMAMPSNRMEALTAVVSGGSFIAPEDGFIKARATATAAGQYLELMAAFAIDSLVHSGGAGLDLSVFIPVQKGQTVTAYYSTNTPAFNFIYAKGAA